MLERSRSIPTLDGWRAVAITLVACHHAGTGFYPSEAAYSVGSPTRFGTIGVSIFFGISGYLICTLLLKEESEKGKIRIAEFYRRRLFRIIPAYLVFVGFLAFDGLLRSQFELTSCLLFFRNYLPSVSGSDYSVHLWSLAVEEHFYLILPAILVTTGRWRLYVIVSLVILCTVWRVSFYAHHLQNLSGINPVFRTDLRMDGLLCGCVAAFLLRNSRFCDLARRHFNIAIWVAITCIFGYCTVATPRGAEIVTTLAIPVMIAGTVLHPSWAVSRLLELAPARWIGRMSYSFYLWQQIFLASSWEHHRLHPLWLQTAPWNVLLAFGAGVASYYLIEIPFISLGRSTSRQARSAPDYQPFANVSR